MNNLGMYDDLQRLATDVAQGRHREVIGGMWDAVGALQLDFMKGQGLAPQHRLLDVGWTMTDASLCGLGQTAASAVMSAIRLWPELFEARQITPEGGPA